MMIKTPEEIEIITEAGARLARVLDEVEKRIAPGVTTQELDTLAEELIRKGGDTPSFLGYQPEGARRPYPGTLCTSVNDEVVHGIPDEEHVLKTGDIIGIDLGLCHKGYHADMARTVAVGAVDKTAELLLKTAKRALDEGIKAIKPGIHVGDIGVAIESIVKPSGFEIVEELGGHGIGKRVHEDPYIPNFGAPGQGEKVEEGMVLAIEPIINEGKKDVYVCSDGYTFKTRDHKRSSHFEHTIVVTKNGAKIVTQ